MDADEAAAWREVAQNASAWLRSSDRPLVELYSRLQAQARRDFADMSAAKLSLLAAVASKLGLGPVDRAKLNARAEEIDPAVEEFFN